MQKILLAALQRVNDKPWIALVAVLIPYFVFSTFSAAVKPLWVDEQFTYYVAQKGGWRAIWAMLSSGGDNHPPLDYWLRSVIMAGFGTSELAFRSLSIVGFSLSVLCVYWFLRRRVEPVFALIGVLVPFSTVVYEVSVEGRYLALVLVCASVALVSWQAATEGNRFGLLMLAGSLAAGLFTDYNAALSFVPIVVGEAVRTALRRKVDLPIWVAIVVAVVSGSLLLPLIKGARQFAGAFWTPVGLFYAIDIYSTMFLRSATVFVGFLALFVLFGGRRDAAPAIVESEAKVPLHEVAAALSCLLLPLVCYVLARFVTGALYWRYVLETSVGAAILVAYSIRRVAGVLPIAPMLLLVCLFGNALLHEGGIAYRSRNDRANLRQDNLQAVLPASDIPVVIGANGWGLRRLHYASEALRRRVTFVYDLDAGRRALGSDTPERGMAALRILGPMRITPYSDFIRTTRHFWLVFAVGEQEWLAGKLFDDGASVEVRGTYRGAPVFEVRLP